MTLYADGTFKGKVIDMKQNALFDLTYWNNWYEKYNANTGRDDHWYDRVPGKLIEARCNDDERQRRLNRAKEISR